MLLSKQTRTPFSGQRCSFLLGNLGATVLDTKGAPSTKLCREHAADPNVGCGEAQRGCQAACISLAAWTPGPGPHWRLRRWRPGTPGPRGPRILPGQPPESRRRPGRTQSRAGGAGRREVRRRHPTGLLDAGITLRLTGLADHGFPRSNCRASRQGKRQPTYKPKDPNRIPPPHSLQDPVARRPGTHGSHSTSQPGQPPGSSHLPCSD